MTKKIVVIGAGPGGYPAALKAASLGAEVTLIEKDKVGGVCLNCGCIPSKSLLDAAHRFESARRLPALCEDGAEVCAQDLTQKISWQKVQARQKAATQKLTAGIMTMLKAKKVTVIAGEASFKNAQEVLVKTAEGEQTLPFDACILATGSTAFFPPVLQAVKDKVYDNSNIFDMPRLPKTLTIIGGGVIGCEFAELMHGFGVQVNIVEMQDRLLPLMDEGLSRALTQSFTKRGIRIYTSQSAQNVTCADGKKTVTLSDGTVLESEEILAAIGRSVDLSAMGLEALGISWSRKGVTVDPHTLLLKDNIYAVGDVNGLCLLAHAATRQGEVAAQNACGQTAQYHNEQVPSAIYTRPEIACVGLTKQAAQEQGIDVKFHKAFLLASGRAQAQDETEGYFELLSNRQTGQLLGANFCGANATELIHVVSVMLAAQMTVETAKEIIFAHPTLAESIGDALHK